VFPDGAFNEDGTLLVSAFLLSWWAKIKTDGGVLVNGLYVAHSARSAVEELWASAVGV
jgi:hypothetical protein